MPTRVVILGGGFAGLNVARHLERLARRGELDVTIVNRENHTLFTPMLPEVSSGSIEPRHIAPPLRAVLRRTQFELGEITQVDLAARTVTVERRSEQAAIRLPYDQLVIALGAESSTHGVTGAREHAFPLTTLQDAVTLRNVVITALETAATLADDDERRRLTTFVVVGGGFTGVEAAGELLDFLRSAARFYPRIAVSDLRVTLIAGANRLLGELPVPMGLAAQRMLRKRGVEIVFDDHAARVDAQSVTLASGARVESRCVVWSAGVAPSALAASLALDHAAHHALSVNADLSVVNAPGIWALGDCAHVPAPGGGAYPPTAQHAVREAERLARNLIARVRGGSTQPYRYRSRGMMASLGAREGLALLGSRAIISGLPAWLLWRAYYLLQLPGRDRRLRVLLDWTLALRFPEDISTIR
jgi:NADH dehydrogenase